jgi:hypothetical protein
MLAVPLDPGTIGSRSQRNSIVFDPLDVEPRCRQAHDLGVVTCRHPAGLVGLPGAGLGGTGLFASVPPDVVEWPRWTARSPEQWRRVGVGRNH